ncbi:hypothetical protein AB685_16625 [Bacillus sp. LL01]|uniref:hypothetical protein n=1 Tax=Bacillus sp. LL01 TaxID=1665556 RepID=UPI00064D15FC|nr:hypothetical protein [Bacillus sp. LL01]KMJ57620.1 hypothetical protein AB685_16625 [Bacillus sp. LL01]
MEFIETIFFIIGALLFTNFFFALLYLLSRSAGEGLINGISHSSECLGTLLVLPFLGLTHFVAILTYDRFNWFVARVVILLYAIFLFIIFFVLLILADYF